MQFFYYLVQTCSEDFLAYRSLPDSTAKFIRDFFTNIFCHFVVHRHALNPNSNPNRLRVWVMSLGLVWIKHQNLPNSVGLCMSVFSKLFSLYLKYLFIYVNKQNIFIRFKLLSKKQVDLGNCRM
jgi:hypothetical protein